MSVCSNSWLPPDAQWASWCRDSDQKWVWVPTWSNCLMYVSCADDIWWTAGNILNFEIVSNCFLLILWIFDSRLPDFSEREFLKWNSLRILQWPWASFFTFHWNLHLTRSSRVLLYTAMIPQGRANWSWF